MKFKFGVLTSIIFFILVAFISLNLGSYQISLLEIGQLLFGKSTSSQTALIFYGFRLPRLVLAALLGGSLALAGYIIQTLTRNPIADVGLLGINSGAACGSVLYFMLIGAYFSEVSNLQYASLLVFGVIGSLLAIVLNLALSLRGNKLQMSVFILNGIGINLGFSALTTYFSLKINPEDYERVNQWLEGSVASANWETIQKIIPVVILCTIILMLTADKLAMLRYSEEHLINLGFSIYRWRLFFLFLAAILVSSTVFVAGSISFVSLLVPHVTLLYVKRNSNWLIPMLFLNGMTFIVLADSLAKNIFAPNEIPLNAVIGGIGIVYLIFIYLKTRRKKFVTADN